MRANRRAVTDGVLTGPDSRAASNKLLSSLRTSRYTPSAWSLFLDRAARRSVRQALDHRWTLLDATVMHVGLAVLDDRVAARGWRPAGC